MSKSSTKQSWKSANEENEDKRLSLFRFTVHFVFTPGNGFFFIVTFKNIDGDKFQLL